MALSENYRTETIGRSDCRPIVRLSADTIVRWDYRPNPICEPFRHVDWLTERQYCQCTIITSRPPRLDARLTLEQFRCCVRRTTTERIQFASHLKLIAEAKVSDLDVEVSIKEKVLRLSHQSTVTNS